MEPTSAAHPQPAAKPRSPANSLCRSMASRPSRNSRCAYSSACSQTAFSRIVSKKNVTQSVLPAFLRVSSGENLSFLQNFHVNIDESDAHQSTQPEEMKTSKLEEPMLMVRNRPLTRGDLLSIKEARSLTASALDACLALLKQMNSELLKKKLYATHVLISNSAFAYNVFAPHGHKLHSKANVVKYDLIVIDFKANRVTHYNPMKGYPKDFLLATKRFLEGELAHHERVSLQDTPLNNLTYEEVLEDFDATDSGIYVLKQAEKLCTGRAVSLTRDSIDSGRSEILQFLYLNSKKIYDSAK